MRCDMGKLELAHKIQVCNPVVELGPDDHIGFGMQWYRGRDNMEPGISIGVGRKCVCWGCAGAEVPIKRTEKRDKVVGRERRGVIRLGVWAGEQADGHAQAGLLLKRGGEVVERVDHGHAAGQVADQPGRDFKVLRREVREICSDLVQSCVLNKQAPMSDRQEQAGEVSRGGCEEGEPKAAFCGN